MQDARTTVLFNGSAAASGNGSELNIAQPYTSAIIYLDCSAATGTSPTLNVRIQEVVTKPAAGDVAGPMTPPTGTKVYDDFVAFAQVTGVATRVIRLVGGANTENVLTSGALAAATLRNGPIGGIWRVQYTIGGTNPNFTFSVCAKLFP